MPCCKGLNCEGSCLLKGPSIDERSDLERERQIKINMRRMRSLFSSLTCLWSTTIWEEYLPSINQTNINYESIAKPSKSCESKHSLAHLQHLVSNSISFSLNNSTELQTRYKIRCGSCLVQGEDRKYICKVQTYIFSMT